jgi:antitoxin (DNA-binding transcriptional repressor) of toxin-antitoxin stability system
MRFISSREIRSNPAHLWEVREGDEAVITVNGKPRAIVVAVGEDLEETLASVRRARAASALEKIRMQSRKRGLDSLPAGEIAAEIHKVRTGR